MARYPDNQQQPPQQPGGTNSNKGAGARGGPGGYQNKRRGEGQHRDQGRGTQDGGFQARVGGEARGRTRNNRPQEQQRGEPASVLEVYALMLNMSKVLYACNILLDDIENLTLSGGSKNAFETEKNNLRKRANVIADKIATIDMRQALVVKLEVQRLAQDIQRALRTINDPTFDDEELEKSYHEAKAQVVAFALEGKVTAPSSIQSDEILERDFAGTRIVLRATLPTSPIGFKRLEKLQWGDVLKDMETLRLEILTNKKNAYLKDSEDSVETLTQAIARLHQDTPTAGLEELLVNIEREQEDSNAIVERFRADLKKLTSYETWFLGLSTQTKEALTDKEKDMIATFIAEKGDMEDALTEIIIKAEQAEVNYKKLAEQVQKMLVRNNQEAVAPVTASPTASTTPDPSSLVAVAPADLNTPDSSVGIPATSEKSKVTPELIQGLVDLYNDPLTLVTIDEKYLMERGFTQREAETFLELVAGE